MVSCLSAKASKASRTWGPFHYYLSSDPLTNGMHWGHGAMLLSVFAILVVAAIRLFDNRDFRQSA